MKGAATRLIHSGEGDAGAPAPLVSPIYETTTFVFDSAEEVRACNEGRSSKFLDPRYRNPTVVGVERTLASLDGADSALVFSSGMGATATTLLGLVKTGDEVVCAAAIYGGTLHLLNDLLVDFGIRTRFVSLEELAAPESIISAQTRLVWFETPTNPTLRCVDIGRIASSCRARGVTSVIDNTFATPINQQPLALGVDLSMQSATKYLNGHSDVTAGVVCGPSALVDRIAQARRLLGTVLDPHPAYLLGRGLKTMAVRVARQNATAQAVAEFLAQDGRVSQVYYPGLVSHPDHDVARRQMTGFGGMVCFDVGGQFERAARVYDRLRLITRAASLEAWRASSACRC